MKVFEEFNLKEYNSYRLNSTCKRAFFPENEQDFIDIFKNQSTSEKIVLGGGYNVILAEEYYDKDFILIGDTFSKVMLGDEIVIEAEAGANTKTVSIFAQNNGLTGFEIFYDIPSSIGGAVVMNAGASGEEIKDIITKVRYLDLLDLNIKEISAEDIGFTYRNSFFQKNKDKLVLKAWFKLQNGNPAQIKDKMESIKAARWAKQPKDYPNAGSVFKRPEGFYVGAMMDELNLKGLTFGGAMVSKKHAGFIINQDNATGKDILNLINDIKKRVKDHFNVDLEVEQRIIV